MTTTTDNATLTYTQQRNLATLSVRPQALVGCWVDGVRGIYAGDAVHQIAQEYGWQGTPCIVADHSDDAGSAEALEAHEASSWATDEATLYLESLAPSGYHFEWCEGSFVFLSDEDEGEE